MIHLRLHCKFKISKYLLNLCEIFVFNATSKSIVTVAVNNLIVRLMLLFILFTNRWFSPITFAFMLFYLLHVMFILKCEHKIITDAAFVTLQLKFYCYFTYFFSTLLQQPSWPIFVYIDYVSLEQFEGFDVFFAMVFI